MNLKDLIVDSSNQIYFDEFGDYFFVVNDNKNKFTIYYLEDNVGNLKTIHSQMIGGDSKIILPIENSEKIVFGRAEHLIIFDKITFSVRSVLNTKVDYFQCGEKEIECLKLKYNKDLDYRCAVFESYLVSDGRYIHMINSTISKVRAFEFNKTMEKVRVFEDIYIVNGEYVCCIDKFSYLDEFDSTYGSCLNG